MIDDINKFSLNFFEKLNIDIENLKVITEEIDIFFIKLQTSDSWILIWNHGSVFESIQWIFRKIFREKFGEDIRVHIEINDYIHNRDAKLFAFIDKEVSKAKETGRNMKLPNLNAYERKKVHSYVAHLKNSEIITKSKWEWRERRLYIMHKNKNLAPKPIKIVSSKLEIDIDWDDI